MLENTGGASQWKLVLAELQAQIPPKAVEVFIAPLTCVSLTSEELVLAAPTTFIRLHVRDHFTAQILAAVLKVLNISPRLTFVTLPQSAPRPAAAESEVVINEPPAAETGVGQPLIARYTFSSFIVGRPNRFAYDAAVGVAAQAPDARHNPLFLYGGVGLGKTHLMHAIGNEVRRRRKDLKIVYFSSERFMNAFMRALREKSMIEFKDMLRAADVLLIDDVHFLAGKEFTQEEFFHALNDLLGAGKQLVFTADRSPRAIDGISDRIKSRLAGGIEIDLHPTDFELRYTILQARRDAETSEARARIGEDVLQFLAQKIVSNVRDLEGAYNKLALLAMATDEPVTVERTRDFLADILRTHDRKITVDEIMKRVADYYNVRPSDMLSPRRARAIARPRQIAMYFAKKLTTRSLPEIGRRFGGRDHTTVIHAVRRIEELRSTDSTLDDELVRLQRLIEE